MNAVAQAKALVGYPVPGFAEGRGSGRHNLPPKFQAEEIHCPMREDPPQCARLHVHFAQTTHAGAPPRFDTFLKTATKEKHVSLTPWESRWLELFHGHRKGQLGLLTNEISPRCFFKTSCTSRSLISASM